MLYALAGLSLTPGWEVDRKLKKPFPDRRTASPQPPARLVCVCTELNIPGPIRDPFSAGGSVC